MYSTRIIVAFRGLLDLVNNTKICIFSWLVRAKSKLFTINKLSLVKQANYLLNLHQLF